MSDKTRDKPRLSAPPRGVPWGFIAQSIGELKGCSVTRRDFRSVTHHANDDVCQMSPRTRWAASFPVRDSRAAAPATRRRSAGADG